MGVRYLLDSDICIYIMNETSPNALRIFNSASLGDVGMSVITHGELLTGANKSNVREKVLSRIQILTEVVLPLPLPEKAAECYGTIRADLEKKGKPIGGHDLWIAAHAIALDVTLITNNTREFHRVSGLKIDNWH